MKFIKNRVVKDILDATSDWKKVKITKTVPDQPSLHNRRCMFNAIEEYHRRNCVAVLEVIGDTDAIAHYLCLDSNGDIYDPTLGWNYSGCEFRLHKYIHPDVDGGRMGDRLYDFKDELFDMCRKSTKRLAKLAMFEHKENCL